MVAVGCNCYSEDFLARKYDVWCLGGFWRAVDPKVVVEELRGMLYRRFLGGGRELLFLENVGGVLDAFKRGGVALWRAVIYGRRGCFGAGEVFIPLGVDLLGEVGGVMFAAQVFAFSSGVVIWAEVPADFVSRGVEEKALKRGFVLERDDGIVRILMFPRKNYGGAVRRLKRFLLENIGGALKV